MKIEFYHLLPKEERLSIEQCPVDRDWMDQSVDKYAYRCLPLTYANRHGWCIRLLEDVEVIWNLSDGVNETKVLKGQRQKPGSNFVEAATGNGIISFHFNSIPRTSKDWNLWIMGAPNLIIPGIHPTSGIVESDWMYSPPTMNWKITEPNKVITFKKGDPVIFFFPVHKSQMEEFVLEDKEGMESPEIWKHFSDFRDYRISISQNGGSAFGKTYLIGIRPDGTKPEWDYVHKTKIKLNGVKVEVENDQ